MRRLLPKLGVRAGLTALGIALAIVAGAVAYFTSSGTGTAAGNVGSLNTPTISAATPGAGTVALSWSSVTPPAGSGGVTYYVRRDGGVPQAGALLKRCRR